MTRIASLLLRVEASRLMLGVPDDGAKVSSCFGVARATYPGRVDRGGNLGGPESPTLLSCSTGFNSSSLERDSYKIC